jgi:hypothetical protein
MMQSNFCLSGRTELSVVLTRISVNLKKIICRVDDDTADCSFEDTGKVISGKLGD